MKNNWITKFIGILFLIIFYSNLSFTLAHAGWFDKKIKVTKCYRSNFIFKSYKDMKSQSLLEPELTAEIDLKKETVIVTSVWDGKLTISKHPILAATDDYITTVPDPLWGTWVFDLKKEGMTGKNANPSGQVVIVDGKAKASDALRCLGDCVHKCKFK